MPKASKITQCEQHIEQVLPEESDQEETSSDQEVFFNPQPSTSNKAQVMPSMSMYMPYIEGPTVDWTVNHGLYNRFLKWRLKCEIY